MRINQSKTTLRSFSDPLRSVEVVTGDGHIKTVYFDNHIPSPILNIQKMPNGIMDVQVSATYQEAGWSLLADLYKDEDRLDDFEARESYRAAIRAGNIGREDFEADVYHAEKGTQKLRYDVAQQFPEELLPNEVLKRRKAGPGVSKRWEPPKKAKKAKGDKQPAA